MDLLQIAAKLFMEKSGGAGKLDIATVMSGLKMLLPTQGSELDLAGLVTKFASQGGGLAAMAQSWLGDGGNQSLSIDTIMDVFGKNKVSDFASTVGMSTEGAAGGLADMIPSLIDKSSSGGSLQQGSAMDIGKKLLGSLF